MGNMKQLKVLMLGWEFPPKVSGGLGTACKGIATALSKNSYINLTFVTPTLPVLKKHKGIKFEHAEEKKIVKTTYYDKTTKLPIKLIKIESELRPYKYPVKKVIEVSSFKEKTDRVYKKTKVTSIELKGGYGPDFYEEVYDYSVLAQSIIDKNEFDIIHAHDWMTFQAGIAAKKISGKPLVLHFHSTDFDRSPTQRNESIYDVEQWGIHEADAIIAVSHYEKEKILKRYSSAKNKIHVVHNAVSKDFLKPAFKLKKEKDEHWVTFIGRLTEQKAPFDFIEAARVILRRIPKVKFIMAGDGDLFEEIKNKIYEYRLRDKILLTGFLNENEVAGLLEKSDVYIMPSVAEPFGIAALEAALANVPVIVTENAGVKEILTQTISVESGDVHAIADRVTWLINEPWYANGVRKANTETISELTWENSTTKIIDVYKLLCEF